MLLLRRTRVAEHLGPLQGRDFRLLWTGQAISQMGDWMNRVGLIVLVYHLVGQPLSVAFVLLSQLLPRVLLLPLGGVLADRWPKRQLMLTTDYLRALLALSFILVDLYGAGTGGVVATCALVVALQTLTSLFNPARSAATPAIVPAEQLGAANALNGITSQAAMLAGPVLGTALLALWDVRAVFIGNALTFLCSALFLWFMRLHEPARRSGRRQRPWHEIQEGAAVVAQSRVLQLLFAGFFGVVTINLCLSVTLVDLLTGVVGRPADDLGIWLTMVGVGGIPGAALGGWLAQRSRQLTIYFLAILILGLDTILIGLAPTFVVVALALIVNGLLTTTTDVISETTTARLAPSDRVGRVFGLQQWITTIGFACGAMIGGGVPLLIGTPATVIGQGSIIGIAALLGLLVTLSLPANRCS